MHFLNQSQVMKLLDKYKPESKQAKKQRLLAKAEKKADGKDDAPSKRPPVVRQGLNTVRHFIFLIVNRQLLHLIIAIVAIMDFLFIVIILFRAIVMIIDGHRYRYYPLFHQRQLFFPLRLPLSSRRRRLSWSSSPTTWIRSSWSCICPPCAAKWASLTASSRERPDLEESSEERHAPL